MSEENDPIKNELMPPYGTLTRTKYIIDLLSDHSFPKINSSILKSRGFSGSDAAKAVLGLKFLGIIDESGYRTEFMAKLQLVGEERKSAIENIVKTAYKLLFEQVKEPNKLQREELINDFITIYRCSKYQAEPAVPNFLWLCSEAGLETTVPAEGMERKQSVGNGASRMLMTKKNPLTGKPRELNASGSNFNDLVELGEFKLSVPSSWSLDKTRQAIAKGDFKNVYDELEKLAEKLKRDSADTGGTTIL